MATYAGKLPFFEKDMEYVGVAKLRRRMSRADLLDLKRPILIIDSKSDCALAVLMNAEQYQAFLEAYLETIKPAMDAVLKAPMPR